MTDLYKRKCVLCNRKRENFIITENGFIPVCHECNLSIGLQEGFLLEEEVEIYINFYYNVKVECAGEIGR